MVSVLLCTYNEKSDFLASAIESILTQTWKEFEFLIVNDGTTDEASLEIIDCYRKLDSRIVVENLSNHGLTMSLNTGLKLLCGQIVFRQDSDDWSEPTRIERQIEFMERHPEVVIAGTQVNVCREDGLPLWKYTNPAYVDVSSGIFMKYNPFIHGSCCFRRSVALDIGGYRKELRYSQDYDFFWRLCEKGPGANIIEPLYNLRMTGGSLSAIKAKEQMKCRLVALYLGEMRQSHYPEDLDCAIERASLKMERSFKPEDNYFELADRYLFSGHFRKSFGLYLQGLGMHKLSIRGILKLIRFVGYVSVPFMRKWLVFRGPGHFSRV